MNRPATDTISPVQDICPTCGRGCGCNLSVGPQPRLAARLDGTTLTITHSADSPWNQIPELTIKDHNGADTHTLNLARGASTTLDHTPGNSIQITALGDHPDHWETPHTEWSFQVTLTNGITTPLTAGTLTSGLHLLNCPQYPIT